MKHVNILPLIYAWLDNDRCDRLGAYVDRPRQQVKDWLLEPGHAGKNRMEWYAIPLEAIELVLDCFSAAGIVRNGEQEQTVYGGYSYE